MATSDNPPEGGFPVPSTYPNPLANNVNMHAIPWAPLSTDATPVALNTKQTDPVRVNGAGGSAYEGS